MEQIMWARAFAVFFELRTKLTEWYRSSESSPETFLFNKKSNGNENIQKRTELSTI
jgi:hypothetical protein